jgi:hypothetical protein
MNVHALPIRRTTPLADAAAVARRCAQFALQTDNDADMAALMLIGGREAGRYRQLFALGVRR